MREEYLPDHVLLTAARVEQRHGQTDDPAQDGVTVIFSGARALGPRGRGLRDLVPESRSLNSRSRLISQYKI